MDSRPCILIAMFKAGEYLHNGQYAVFQPTLLKAGVDVDSKTITSLLIEASRYLGELDAYSQFAQDIDFFIKMSVFREATSSNKIEGATTSLREVLMDRNALKDQEKRDDWDEVHNYIEAVYFAIDQLTRKPLAYNLICDTHKILLSGVRGESKSPGRIRTVQNWIGGRNPSAAIFVPPAPNEVKNLMHDLDEYWHNEQIDTHKLLRIAIMHYQFETIHPFLDGNGRLGRLLVTIQLIDGSVLQKPAFYLSEYIDRNRQTYYEALNFVRNSEYGLNQWIEFFLTGVIETAKKTAQTLHKSLELKKVYQKLLSTKLSPQAQKNANKLLDHLFIGPVTTVAMAASALGCSRQAANELIKKLCQLKLLTEISNQKRNRLFILDEYFQLFSSSDSKG